MGWGRGATYAPGSLDESFSNVNHPPPMQKNPENGELSSFVLIFTFQAFQFLQVLAFLEK